MADNIDSKRIETPTDRQEEQTEKERNIQVEDLSTTSEDSNPESVTIDDPESFHKTRERLKYEARLRIAYSDADENGITLWIMINLFKIEFFKRFILAIFKKEEKCKSTKVLFPSFLIFPACANTFQILDENMNLQYATFLVIFFVISAIFIIIRIFTVYSKRENAKRILEFIFFIIYLGYTFFLIIKNILPDSVFAISSLFGFFLWLTILINLYMFLTFKKQFVYVKYSIPILFVLSSIILSVFFKFSFWIFMYFGCILFYCFLNILFKIFFVRTLFYSEIFFLQYDYLFFLYELSIKLYLWKNKNLIK
ncbi:hypothetical protein TUBRATIS_000770 [Tubulinosema ratisbonensis]|uniref:Uncharacterized protein n=1 Tax=Tubulinosema ratisbonensis TaxID=291195 RepID=A0A437AQY7_9MICR|nr:hypothetical protein TUBRATIS_000770 [Tubulinosema ratisbonensis]